MLSFVVNKDEYIAVVLLKYHIRCEVRQYDWNLTRRKSPYCENLPIARRVLNE